jgi:invasion protein IalB
MRFRYSIPARRHIASGLIAIVSLSGTTAGLRATQQPNALQPPAPPPTSPKPAPQTAPQTLPGGASQVQETYGDWRVTCVQQNGQKVCTLSQQQADKDSRQLVLGIELKTTAANKAEGTMVLPFGLAVDKPIVLQVDEGASQTVHFRTCVPVGCLVALTFDPASISSLKKGTTLNVKAAGDGGQDAAFKISLKGFADAFDRTEALTK